MNWGHHRTKNTQQSARGTAELWLERLFSFECCGNNTSEDLSILSAISASIELFLSPLIGVVIDSFGRKRPSVCLYGLIVMANLGVMLLFHYGSHMRTLALLLLLQSAPAFMGDVFQMFAKEEWGLLPKDFANMVALFGIIGITSNISLPLVLQYFGLRSFSLFATFSSLFFPLTAIFADSYRPVLVAGCIGLYAATQKVGTSAAMTSLATELGVPQGQLQGEKASMLALLKIGCPVVYSMLYLKGKSWSSDSASSMGGTAIGLEIITRKIGRKLPFVLNIVLGCCAFAVTWQNL
ncbi:hypothetical protein ACHAXR_005880 [Thalassiosira sp. AJA248-18]